MSRGQTAGDVELLRALAAWLRAEGLAFPRLVEVEALVDRLTADPEARVVELTAAIRAIAADPATPFTDAVGDAAALCLVDDGVAVDPERLARVRERVLAAIGGPVAMVARPAAEAPPEGLGNVDAALGRADNVAPYIRALRFPTTLGGPHRALWDVVTFADAVRGLRADLDQAGVLNREVEERRSAAQELADVRGTSGGTLARGLRIALDQDLSHEQLIGRVRELLSAYTDRIATAHTGKVSRG